MFQLGFSEDGAKKSESEPSRRRWGGSEEQNLA